MNDRHTLQNPPVVSLSKRELMEMGRRAEKEREELLRKRPALREFQNEIDRRLAGAGGFQGRMAVLHVMMEAKLMELAQHMQHLQAISRGYEWRKLPGKQP